DAPPERRSTARGRNGARRRARPARASGIPRGRRRRRTRSGGTRWSECKSALVGIMPRPACDVRRRHATIPRRVRLFNTATGWIAEPDRGRARLPPVPAAGVTARAVLHSYLSGFVAALPAVAAPGSVRPPVEQQEVWAAGVTYFRSRTARM